MILTNIIYYITPNNFPYILINYFMFYLLLSHYVKLYINLIKKKCLK